MNKKTIIFVVFFISVLAVATSNKVLEGDIWKSPDHSKVYTPPAATDTLVGRTSTDTLTGKTMSGGSNTFSSIPFTAVTGTVPVNQGGTNLTSGTSGGVLGFTGTGTLTSSAALAASQLVIGGGAGSTPTALAAGSQFQVLTMGASNPGYSAVNLAQSAAVSGALGVVNGGSGTTTITAHGVLLGEGTSAVNATSAGTSGQPLLSGGSSADSNWGTLGISFGGSGQTTANAALNAFLPSQTGNNGFVLSTNGTSTSWISASGAGTVTSVNASVPTGFSVSGGPITGAGTLAITYSGTAIPAANGGTGLTTGLPGFNYANIFYPASTSNYWSNANTSLGDFTAHGTIPTPTVFQSSGFGAISVATSSLPGFNFSAPRTGTIKITAIATSEPTSNATLATWVLDLSESTTSTDIATVSGLGFLNSGVNYPIVLSGYFNTTASTTYNFKLKSAVSAGTFFIGDGAATGVQLSFQMEYIN